MYKNIGLSSFVAGALFVAACGGAGDSGGSIRESEPSPTTGDYVLVWSDEFDGDVGQWVDSSKWTSLVGGSGWGQSTLDYKTNATDPASPNFTTSNAYLDGMGHLTLRAIRETIPFDTCWYGQCDFTSALLVTAGKLELRYGRVEIRMKTPPGRGFWPAFWMYGANGDLWGEIDIVEIIGRDPEGVYQAAHGEGFTGGLISLRQAVSDSSVASDFHEYAVEWRPEELIFFLDGRVTGVISPRSLPSGVPWPFDSFGAYLILDLAVGSDSSWSGAPTEETPFPAELMVDYVRVYNFN